MENKHMTGQLDIRCLRGNEIEPYIHDLVRLRIEVFKDFPYLYAGNLDYEKQYLQTYLNCPHSIMVLALDNQCVVGASTAIPLEYEEQVIQQPFLDNGFDIQRFFYFGESVLLSAYRGQRIYRQFFSYREQAAREYGCKTTVFCAVERPQNHPCQPKGYQPLDKVWQHFGYKKMPNLKTQFSWQDIGDKAETSKPMVFWLRELG